MVVGNLAQQQIKFDAPLALFRQLAASNFFSFLTKETQLLHMYYLASSLHNQRCGYCAKILFVIITLLIL